jgi:glycosyltransferase 2 family protein
MQRVFRILLFVSLLFFVWYLYQADYLVFKGISFDLPLLLVSLLLLFAGFFLTSISWGLALRLRGYEVEFPGALVSHGKYIFSKYIPGKFWMILGRASYLAGDKSRLRSLSLVSLQEQLLFVFWGLVLSIIPTFLISKNNITGIILLAVLILFIFFLFSPGFHSLSSLLFKKIFGKVFNFKPMKALFFLKVSIPVLSYWLLWSAGFWFLMLSVFENVPLLMAFAYPAGMTYGFIVVFIPAGVGVREGIIASFLLAGGLSTGDAVTISVISRLWFAAGEVFLFILAWTIKLAGKTTTLPGSEA